MEFVSSILGGSFTTCVVDPIRSRFRVACNLEDNYNELETARANLVAKRDDQQVKLEAEKRQDGVVASKETELWFSQVNKAVSDADNLKVENEKQRRGTCRNLFCWWPRYQLGKRVEKLKRHVEELYGDAEAKYGVIPVQEKGMKLTTVSIEGQSRTDTLKHQIIEAVLDDRYVVVGLHGMGGIGKTTLLQHVNNHFRGSEHFDSVIFTTLSATPDFVEIQKQIAKSLGLDLNQDDNYLQQKMSRLFQTSKFLLILDDMWERVPVIELSEIIFNIRLPNRDNGCKILMASRSPWVVTRFVTRFTGRDSLRTIQVNSLPRDEAWNLFVERVGNEITSKRTIKPLAEKVLRKCDGLPLAIIVIGGTMSGKKTEGEWRDAVRELEQPSTSNLNGIVEELFPKLMFSFEKLKPMDQSLFLYCCLFPEDDFIENESLVNFAIGEETLCDEMHKLGHMRDKVDALLGNLRNSSMLEEAFGRAFRMHDVMREFALWISKYIVKARARLTEAPDASEWPKATKISLMKNSEMKSLPQLPNSCPQLHTLLLNHCTHIKEIPQEHFLEHITALRVLDLSSTGIKNLPPTSITA